MNIAYLWTTIRCGLFTVIVNFTSLVASFNSGMCIELIQSGRDSLPKVDEHNETYHVDEAGVSIEQRGCTVPDTGVNHRQLSRTVSSL